MSGPKLGVGFEAVSARLTSGSAECPIGPSHRPRYPLKITKLRRRYEKNVDVLFNLSDFTGRSCVVQAQQTGETEKVVATLEQQWLQSQKTNNPDLVAPLLAERFVETGSDGKVMNKTEMLAISKATKYVSAEYEDVKVAVFGDTAIATGGFKAKGTDDWGKPMDIHERWTDTWIKMPSGKWQCVASHGSTIKM